MMVRIGVVYTLSSVAGILGAFVWLRVTETLLGTDEKNWAHRFGLAKLSGIIALLILIVMPIALSTGFGNYVWVIDEGNKYRRYILYGSKGAAETLDGRRVEFDIGPGKVVETVVNGTAGPILIESVQYGGAVKIEGDFRETVEAGKAIALNQPLNEVMDPPDSLKVTNGVGFRLYAHQVK